MTSERLGEILKGYFADTTCTKKIPLGSMESQVCADPGARIPIGASRIFGLKKDFEFSLV
jgi:hypothetical protein